jgi:hypothetical protein
MRYLLSAILIPLLPLVYGQTCENYGTANGNECSCPTGFGGPTCSLPGCHGTIFDGAQRQFAQTTGSAPANLTAAGCGCEGGWGGTGCNVCQTANACQSAYAATVSGTPDIGTVPSDVQNGTMVCNTAPRVWAAGQMSCQVIVRPSSNASSLHTYMCTSRIQPCKPFTQANRLSTSNEPSIQTYLLPPAKRRSVPQGASSHNSSTTGWSNSIASPTPAYNPSRITPTGSARTSNVPADLVLPSAGACPQVTSQVLLMA